MFCTGIFFVVAFVQVLDETIDITQLDAFKRADVYAFGLIMWEITRRTDVDGGCEEHQLPYFDLVQPDPTIEEMKKVSLVSPLKKKNH